MILIGRKEETTVNFHCGTPFEGDVCPVCGSRKVRPVREDDLCVLAEGNDIVTGMLCDVLRQENIPYYRQSRTGAAMAVLLGRQLEVFEVLVPYACYGQAREIEADFSSPAPEPPEGWEFPEDGSEGESEQEEESED